MEIIFVYLFYFLISIWLTIKVGNSLHKNGRDWIIHLLGDVHLSDKVNNTLLLLYRLVNVGYILYTLMSGSTGGNTTQFIEFLSVKLGMIVTILAYLHYQNILILIIFSNLKSKYKWEI